MKNSFLLGFAIVFLIGVSTYHGYSNYRYKEVSKNGLKATCQVVKYRFWYEIRNCSKSEMNTAQVGLRQIEEYQIQ